MKENHIHSTYEKKFLIDNFANIFFPVKPDDKFILLDVPYTEVESFLLDPSDQFITLNLVKTEQERQRVFVFETSQKNIIGALVAAYRPALANWVRETADASAPAKRRVKQVGHLINIILQ